MRIKLFTIIILLISFLNVAHSQQNKLQYEEIGFACYAGGGPSRAVENYELKLKDKKYKWISNQLESESSAKKYMSVITLEKLAELEMYKLNETELSLIAKIKKSTELVAMCSGCTQFDEIELKNMFSGEMLMEVNSWLSQNIVN